MDREDAIQALIRTGKTREQCEAFLALLGSGLARRCWAEGPVLSRDEIGEQFEKVSSGYCTRPAVAAVYPRIGGTVLIRHDHLAVDDRAADWRCVDCLHDDVDRAVGAATDPVGSLR